MAYCTLQDLIAACSPHGEEELIQLTDYAGLGVIDMTALNHAIADADREINRYLAGKLGQVSADAVVDVACAIARHRLYGDGVPDRVRQLYEDAIASLKAMAKGEMSVADAAGGVAAAAGDAVVVQSATSVFSRENR